MRDPIASIDINSQYYPPLLREISDPPLRLYARGELGLLTKEKLLAVVGSRRANQYGQYCMMEFLPAVVRAGVSLVSGLAFGVDALSHEICISQHAPTIAVLGGGVDDPTIAPRSNFSLAKRILMEHGLIISEYPPGMPPNKGSFPKRNRIIAGICRHVLIAQAGQASGSLITARLALEYNRDVWAIPGPVNDPLAHGTNKLIQAGAYPITDKEDLLQLLGVISEETSTITKAADGLQPLHIQVIKLLSDTPLHIDQIVHDSGLSAAQAAAVLTELELMERVRHTGGMRYVSTS